MITLINIDSICIGITKDQLERLPSSVNKIETIKKGYGPITETQNAKYREVTGKSIKKKHSAYRIYILHYDNGQRCIAKQKHRGKRFILEFHGLYQYQRDATISTKSLLRRQMAYEIMIHVKNFMINRVDGALDAPFIPLMITDMICAKGRIPDPHRGEQTIWFRTQKQREKENPRTKFTLYDKGEKNDLPFPMERFEIALKSANWTRCGEVTFGQFEAIVMQKMRKTFKSWTGLDVQLLGLDSTRAYVYAQGVNDTHVLQEESLLKQYKRTGKL